jgi:DNA-binding MarR family transcriptional regulator
MTLSEPRTIKDLLSYRVHKLAGALSRGAALWYRREFDVSMVEWRTVALLGGFAPLSLKQLAALAALDKSLVSRTVTALVERNIVLRIVSSTDGREVELRLTPEGERLYQGLMRAARQRDAAFHAALSPTEREVLDRLLLKLEAEAWRQVELSGGNGGEEERDT